MRSLRRTLWPKCTTANRPNRKKAAFTWRKRHSAAAGSWNFAAAADGLTTEFARCGFHVTGVDLSSDMLALLEQKKARLPKRVAERIRTRCCDVFAAEWKETYDFIFLPATTLCLLTGDLHQTAALFTRLSQALTTNGSLMSTFGGTTKRLRWPLCAASFPRAGRVVLYQDRLDVLPGYDVANFLLIEKSAGSTHSFVFLLP